MAEPNLKGSDGKMSTRLERLLRESQEREAQDASASAPCQACYWGEPRGNTHSIFCSKHRN